MQTGENWSALRVEHVRPGDGGIKRNQLQKVIEVDYRKNNVKEKRKQWRKKIKELDEIKINQKKIMPGFK